MAELKITGLRKSFGALEILKGIDLDIAAGEFIVIVGPSGCGKSTLLRCIAGLEEITSGSLTIDGRDETRLPPSRRGMAMVFQSYALYPHMTVFENIAYPLRLQRKPKAEIVERVAATAARLQLDALLERLPRELSGGQRQRVAIGRAIVRDPAIFLFDEPLSNLDASLRIATRLEIAQLKKTLPRTTMIYVTHDQVEAMTLADRVVVLREGRVEQVGTPIDLYDRPASRFVAGFIGAPSMNFLSGRYAEPFGVHSLGVRPEHLVLSEDGPWRGEVIHLENLGSDCYIHARLEDGQTATLRLDARSELPVGSRIFMSPVGRACHLFDANGQVLVRGG